MSPLLSPLKSPVPATDHVVGTLPRSAVEMGGTHRNQITVLPLVSRHRRSYIPSPLKSRWPTIDQDVGTVAIDPAKTWPLNMRQSAASPAGSRQGMSLIPLPSESWELKVVSVRRAVAWVVASVNHTPPSGPAVMSSGPAQ